MATHPAHEPGSESTVPKPPPETAPAPPGPAPAEPRRTTASNRPPAPVPERSFVLTAELGYARLHLDYIVYKPSAPFGRVNGQDIVVGSVVDGFVVEEIGESHIRLRDSRGAVVLRVR